MGLDDADRRRFDALVEEVIADLPEAFAEFIEEVAVVVLDRPDAAMLRELARELGEPIDPDELCGLHTGVANTMASVADSGETPSCIHLFRVGILGLAGGWDGPGGEEGVYEQIAVTLLHEIGHQMGLDENDLDELGYG